MATEQNGITYPVGPDEKSASIMVYTANSMILGEVVVKKIIRVSTWLRTNSAPDVICLYNARNIIASAGGTPNPLSFAELHVMTNQVLAYHLLPPAQDPIDYDPTEPNRRMQPITVLSGLAQIDGLIRMASSTSVGKFLEVTHETYSAVYDAQIKFPAMPSLGAMKVPYILVRQAASAFALRAIR